jgi:hypothetical protein
VQNGRLGSDRRLRMTDELHILVMQPLRGWWTARILEHDIAAEGHTMAAAVATVMELARAHVDFDRRHGRAPLSGFKEASAPYWQAFSQATPLKSVGPLRLHTANPMSAAISVAVMGRPILSSYAPRVPVRTRAASRPS